MATTYVPVNSLNTSTALEAQMTPEQFWQRTIDMFEENNDFWQSMEGGTGSVIVTKSDTAAGRGHTMNIRIESGLYDEPHYGEDTFDDENDFEELLYDDYQLKVGVIRHATSATELAEEHMGLRGEIMNRLPEKLGAWLGRLKTENLDMAFLNQVQADNILFPNGKTKEGIVTADKLTMSYVGTAASLMRRLGGSRAKVGTINGAPAMRLALVACADACTILRQDSTYLDFIKNAGQRGPLNTAFRGEITDLDGVTVVQRDVIDHDGEGAIGSPMNPRARLGVAITAGTTAFDITGGGNATSAAKTKKKYYKYFDGYDYKYSDGTTVSPASATRYVLIVNPPNAATDPNKIGMYAYTTGNNGNRITITARLGSAAAGVRVTSFADSGGTTRVTWNTGVWAGKHTDVHPAGALVIPCNVYGEPLGNSFLLGHGAALRGYGKYRNKRGSEQEEDGFLHKTFVRSYFGQKVRMDRQGRNPAIVVLKHSLHYPDLPLPTIV